MEADNGQSSERYIIVVVTSGCVDKVSYQAEIRTSDDFSGGKPMRHIRSLRFVLLAFTLAVACSSVAQIVVATVPVGMKPDAVAINPVTNQTYVVNRCGGDPNCNSVGTVTIIDGATNNTTPVTVGYKPQSVAVNSVTNEIYVTNLCGNDPNCDSLGTVTVIDGASNNTTAVNVGYQPKGVAVNPVTNQVYVTNACGNDPSCGSGGTVTVIDGVTNNTTTVNVGQGPNAVAVNSVTNKIYVPTGSQTVTVIDGVTNNTQTVTVGFYPSSLAVNSLTNKIYVVDVCGRDPLCNSPGSVTVIDGATNETTNVNVGAQPHFAAVNPVTNKIYVTNGGFSGGNTVTVIDGATLSTTTVTVGTGPWAVAVNSATNKIYVTDVGSADVTVIDGATNSGVYISVGNAPVAEAINAVTNTIYVANSPDNTVTVIAGAVSGSYYLSVSVSPTGAGTVTSTDGFINCPGTCYYPYPSNTQVTLNATPAQGWAFTGWTGACSGTGSCVVTVTQNLSVGATFAPVYTLTVSPSGMGTVTSTDGFINCPGTCSHSYLSGTQVTLNATAAAGWTFSGWSGACSGTGSCLVTMTQNLSVGATFTQLSYTLTASTNGNGTVTSTDGFINCPGICSHSYLSFTQVTLNATPAQGWTFTGWSGACGGTGSCVVTMTQDLSVSATFTPDYTLTVSTTGMGTVTSTDGFIKCPGTCSHTYLSGTQVTLNATPAQGWTFSGWSGACSGTGSCTVTMTLSLSVTATFVGLQFIATTPCRLLDTRQNGGGGPIQGGTYETFNLPQLAQTMGCDNLSTAAAYSLNVTVVPQGPLGYLTIWPAGQSQPLVSTLNSYDGRVKANAAIVSAGVSAAVSIYVTNTTDVLLDIDGYFAPASQSTLAFYPLPPCRVADTRDPKEPAGLGPPYLTGGEPRDFPVLAATTCNIPSSAQAYSLNFTAVPHGFLGYLTVWPTGQNQPVVSTLNAYGGQVTANAAIVQAGTAGKVSTYALDDTDLLIDIDGYFAAPGQGGLSLYPVVPCRVLDTRPHPFQFELSPPVDVVNSPCGVPGTAQAYVFNATVVPQGGLGYLTLWPDGSSQPVVSTLNAYDGAVSSNMAIVPAGSQGKVDAYADPLNPSDPNDVTDLILDISSYFAP
jgi:uncharacterized repeat protein (TIGR02543 family)